VPLDSLRSGGGFGIIIALNAHAPKGKNMATKFHPVTLRAFEIKQIQLSNPADIYSDLKKKLASSVAEERIMRLNQDDDSKESDLISNYEFCSDGKSFFATMMRIMPEAEDTHIDTKLMKQSCFSISDLRRTPNNAAAIYKNHYYIYLNKNHLVTNLSQTTTIKRVESYLNWLLGTHIYEINPIVIPSPDLKVADVKTIKFANPPQYSKQMKLPDCENTQNKKVSLTTKFIKDFMADLFVDSESLEKIDLEQIVSAELLLKLNKPRKMSNEEFQRTFSAILKPVSDHENITFRDSKGNKINGSAILRTKVVEIEKTDNNFLSEPHLAMEMARFISELKP